MGFSAAFWAKGIDLDLGCLWGLEDGCKGVIHVLGEAWGEYGTEPFIRHVGDDRTGAMSLDSTISRCGSTTLPPDRACAPLR